MAAILMASTPRLAPRVPAPISDGTSISLIFRISSFLEKPGRRKIKPGQQVVWIGGPVDYIESNYSLVIHTKQETLHIECPVTEGKWLANILNSMTPQKSTSFTYQSMQESYDQHKPGDFILFWYGDVMEELKQQGLLVL